MVCARGPAPAGQGRAGALSLLRQVTAGHSRLRGTAGQPRLVTAGHSRPGEGTFAPTVQQVVDSLVKRGPASAAFSGSRPRGPAQEGGHSPPLFIKSLTAGPATAASGKGDVRPHGPQCSFDLLVKPRLASEPARRRRATAGLSCHGGLR